MKITLAQDFQTHLSNNVGFVSKTQNKFVRIVMDYGKLFMVP
jgi:hypothetical protein